jgi:D-amino-acid oxidase
MLSVASLNSNHVTVLGGGVVGLTTAVVLQEAGYSVQVFAREFSPNTTSDLAGALWYPSHACPRERTRGWGLETLNELLKLHAEAGAEETGIRLVTGTRHFYRQMGFPWWRNHVPHFRILSEWERPERARTSYEYTVPLLDMPRYLGSYLTQRFRRAGGQMQVKAFAHWNQVLEQSAPIIVNCTGLGSFSLIDDKKLYPVRGQVLETHSYCPSTFNLSADHPEGSVYVIPRARGVLIGGGSKSGVWETDVDTAQSEKILRVASLLDSGVANKSDWTAKVGLRPGRKTIRCEADAQNHLDKLRMGEKLVFHNYGHTGAGVTLSWGCAREILNLVATGDQSTECYPN